MMSRSRISLQSIGFAVVVFSALMAMACSTLFGMEAQDGSNSAVSGQGSASSAGQQTGPITDKKVVPQYTIICSDGRSISMPPYLVHYSPMLGHMFEYNLEEKQNAAAKSHFSSQQIEKLKEFLQCIDKMHRASIREHDEMDNELIKAVAAFFDRYEVYQLAEMDVVLDYYFAGEKRAQEWFNCLTSVVVKKLTSPDFLQRFKWNPTQAWQEVLYGPQAGTSQEQRQQLQAIVVRAWLKKYPSMVEAGWDMIFLKKFPFIGKKVLDEIKKKIYPAVPWQLPFEGESQFCFPGGSCVVAKLYRDGHRYTKLWVRNAQGAYEQQEFEGETKSCFPDGSCVVTEVSRDGHRYTKLWVRNAQGAYEQQEFEGFYISNRDCSPDGSCVVTGVKRDDRAHIKFWVKNAQGTYDQQEFEGDYQYCSPDGSWVVTVVSRDYYKYPKFWVKNARGVYDQQEFGRGFYISNKYYFPNGSYVATEASIGGCRHTKIWVKNAQGTYDQQEFEGEYRYYSPDGLWVITKVERNGHGYTKLWLRDRDRGAYYGLQEFDGNYQYCSPDGSCVITAVYRDGHHYTKFWVKNVQGAYNQQEFEGKIHYKLLGKNASLILVPHKDVFTIQQALLWLSCQNEPSGGTSQEWQRDDISEQVRDQLRALVASFPQQLQPYLNGKLGI